MINEPIHVNDEGFEKAVLQSELPVVVDFWASWCGPCRMVLPLMDAAAKEYAGKIIVAKVNTDENSQRAMEYRVSSIPTLLFVKNGEVKHRHSGTLSQAKLNELIDDLIAA